MTTHLIATLQSFFNISALLGLLHNSTLAATEYVRTESEQSQWQNKIYYEKAAASVDECAAFCRVSYISSKQCDIFSWDGSKCYLGDNSLNSQAITVPTGTSEVYIDPGMAEKIFIYDE